MTQFWPSNDYIPRGGQDSNQMYSNNDLNPQYYPNDNEGSCFNNNNNNSLHYSTMGHQYPSPYQASYMSTQTSPGGLMYLPHSNSAGMSCHSQPPSATLLSQPRSLAHGQYYLSGSHRGHHQTARQPPMSEDSLANTEDQESPNHESGCSEPLTVPLDGYPNVREFDELMATYVQALSPKKQDKALINAKRAANIKTVLIDKKTTSVESAQFRFWVKKMFTLEPRDHSIPARRKKICHEGKPVAIREKLFKILTRAHKQCQHGGRDKTSAQVRRVYSWVPKELISRFVKLCPTCQIRRGTSRQSPTASENSNSAFYDIQSSDASLSRQSRRSSLMSGVTSSAQSPTQISRFSTNFQQQNRWMTNLPSPDKQVDHVATLEAAASAMVNMNMNSPMSPQSLTPAQPKFNDDSATSYVQSNNVHPTAMDAHFQQPRYETIHGYHPARHSSDSHYQLQHDHIYKREHRY